MQGAHSFNGKPKASAPSVSRHSRLRLAAKRRGAIFPAVLLLIATSAQAAETGSITGIVPASAEPTAVAAINRTDGKRVPGKLDPASGKFELTGLPLNAKYDCIIEYGDARLEGINLNVPPSDYVEEQPLEKEDVETIRAKAMRMNKFEDIVEVKTIVGNIQHAAVLLNKLRTKPFFDSKPGEVIWRAELWHFERPEETWLKVQDELAIVLYRERIQRSVYAAKSLTFDPALGGIGLTSEQPQVDLGKIEPPIAKRGIHFRPLKEATEGSSNSPPQ